MKLLVDMNLSPAWVAFLEAHGHKAVRWSEVGPPEAPDHALINWARAHDHVVLTHDHDFGAILTQGGERKPSVITLRTRELLPEAVGERILEVLKTLESELRQGALVIIEPERVRLRPLSSKP